MFVHFSPNMLKTFKVCPRKFYLKYVKNISMPVNDDLFLLGKNIHALASYYLKGENIFEMEGSLSAKESEIWEYLKTIEYLSYEFVSAEYNLSVKISDIFFGGRIDALVKKNDYYYILDYKTGAIPKNPKFDYQTMVYMLAVSKFFKTEKVYFVYLDLKNRTDCKIMLDQDLSKDYEKRLLEISTLINDSEIPVKKSSCSCEYSPICF